MQSKRVEQHYANNAALLELDIDVAEFKRSYRYSTILEKPYGSLTEILEWCKENFKPNRWLYDLEEVNLEGHWQFRFLFKKRADYVVFLLRWK